MVKQLLITLILFTALLAFSCTEKDEIIDEEVYTNLLLEFSILNAMNEAYLGDLTHDDFRLKILAEYDVTAEEFRKSHEYYQQNILEQLDRMEQIGKMLRQERDSVQIAERDYRVANRQPADSLRQRISNSTVQSDTTDSE